MSERADFERFTMDNFAIEIVPPAKHEQRVVVNAPVGVVFIADTAAKASEAVGYPLRVDATPFYLAPDQAMYAAAGRAGIGTVISVYIAPTEDDYLESGMFWHAAEEEHHGA